MVIRREPMQIKDALSVVLSKVESLGVVEVSLHKSYGSILAQPIIAKHDVPPFNRSPYDGYAIRSIDSKGATGQNRVGFHIIGQLNAGDYPTNTLSEKEAIRIMTGAPIPEGADAVVMLEQTVEDGNTFTIRKSFQPGENISFQGEDTKAGELIIDKGTFIHPGIIALLATFGYTSVKVYKKPKVGIICTGSELVPLNEVLKSGQIYNSNGPMLQGQLTRMGIDYTFYGIAKDDIHSTIQLIEKALVESDCVVTTGGVSVGDYDLLPEIYEKMGAQILFNKVAMRPGSITTCAYVKKKLLFGLSGNPSACYTGFEIFVRPVLQWIMGNNKPFLPHIKGVLTEDFKKANPYTRFIRSTLAFNGQSPTVTPAGFNKSNAVTSIAKGNAFIVLPGGSRGFQEGDLVDVLLLGTEDGAKAWNL